jgi:hypothetical protein
MHRTANGKFLDMNALRVKSERTIAVGNSKQNARGDILGTGGEIVMTRDQIMTQYYNAQKGSPLSDNTVYNNTDEVNAAAVADIFTETINNGIEDILSSQITPIQIDPTSPVSQNGGVADATARSEDLAERLRNQRRRI